MSKKVLTLDGFSWYLKRHIGFLRLGQTQTAHSRRFVSGGRRHFRRYVLTVARRDMLMKQRKKKNRNPVARALRSRHLRRRVIPSARAYSRKGVRRYDDDERQQ